MIQKIDSQPIQSQISASRRLTGEKCKLMTESVRKEPTGEG